jgi:hypothetical protein
MLLDSILVSVGADNIVEMLDGGVVDTDEKVELERVEANDVSEVLVECEIVDVTEVSELVVELVDVVSKGS